MSDLYPIHRWSPGDPPLLGVQHDENIGSLQAMIQALYESGGAVGIGSIALNTAGDGVIYTLTDSRTFGPFPLVAPMWKPTVTRVIGETYHVRDTYVVAGSTYLALADHVASTEVATDVAAGKAICIAAAGKNAETFRNAHNPASAYPAFSIVTKTVGSVVTFYKNFIDVAAGGPQPGTFPWGIVSYQEIADTMVRLTVQNKLLSAWAAEVDAKLLDHESRIAALE